MEHIFCVGPVILFFGRLRLDSNQGSQRGPRWPCVTYFVRVNCFAAFEGVPVLGGLTSYAASFLHYTQSRHFYSEPV